MMPGTPTWQMRAPIDGTTNVARFFCRNSPMFWCGRNSARPGTLSPGYRHLPERHTLTDRRLVPAGRDTPAGTSPPATRDREADSIGGWSSESICR